jgi:hypothetical protein
MYIVSPSQPPTLLSLSPHVPLMEKITLCLLQRRCERLSQESKINSMASVAGISSMEPLGGKQGLWPYPSGPSQPSIFIP